MALNTRQLAFIEFYLKSWNASQAARDAGYTTKANVQGSRLLANASIQAAIQSRLAELKMSADEVLTRLADHARGSIAPFVVKNVNDEPIGFNFGDDKPIHLIKKLTITNNSTSIELYDAQAALALLGKAHGLFVDRNETTVTANWIFDPTEATDTPPTNGAAAPIPDE